MRGLPFLTKKMKRLGGAKIVEDININHEPNLWKINAEFPTPVELSKNCLDYAVLNSINRCISDGDDWPSWAKAKVPFDHRAEIDATPETENEATVDAAVAQKPLSPHRNVMMNRSGGPTGGDSALLSSHNRLSSTQESLHSTHMDASLQQHQRLLRDQQICHDQLEQRNLMQQPLHHDMNQQVNSLLLNLLTNERNQSTTSLPPQQYQAWPQHHLQTAPSAANTAYPYMLRNTGRLVNEYNPIAYDPVAGTLSPTMGDANLSASLSRFQQFGNHISFPSGSVDHRSLHLLQANQPQGRPEAALNHTTVLEPLSLQRTMGDANLSASLSRVQRVGNHVSFPSGSVDLRSLHLLEANQPQGRMEAALNPTTVLEPLSLQRTMGDVNLSASLSRVQRFGNHISFPSGSVDLRSLHLLQANQPQGRLEAALNPTTVLEPLSLQRTMGDVNFLSAGMSRVQRVGNHISFPSGSVDLRSLHLLEANQPQGRPEAALDPTTVLSIVMRNIAQTQLHQAITRPNMFELYPHLSQTMEVSFGQPSHSAVGILAETSQSQRLQHSQQPQASQLAQNSLSQQHQMASSLPQQNQQMQQHDRQDRHPDQPQDNQKNWKEQRVSD
jgi:hypothetical protein